MTRLILVAVVLVLSRSAAYGDPCGLTSTPPEGGGRLSLVPGFESGTIPLIMIHGDGAERNDAACGNWQVFINTVSSAFKARYRLYVFIHDTSEPIGFDGHGNAEQLGHAIEREPTIHSNEQIGLIAHSRGGLVARAYLNYYNGGQGHRVFVLLTLGSPHHGTPGAVVDWGLATIRKSWADKQTCIANALYNTSDPATYCTIMGKAKSGPVAVQINRIGTTDLSWDNFDGEKAGMPAEGPFTMSGALPGPHVLSIRDANIEPPASTTDTDIHQSEDNGSLAELNRVDRFLSRLVAYGSYLVDPREGDLWTAKFGNEHDRLRYAAQVMGTFESAHGAFLQYAANDGLVPIQSSLLLNVPVSATPIYTVTRKLIGGYKVKYPLEISHKSTEGRTRARLARLFVGFDHSELRDTVNGPNGIAYLIERDISDAFDLFGAPVTSPKSPVLASVVPGSIVARPADQSVSFTGHGFQAGVVMDVLLPGGSVVTLSGAQITSVAEDSITALVTFHDAGRYVFTARNPDGGVSNPFAVDVQPSEWFVLPTEFEVWEVKHRQEGGAIVLARPRASGSAMRLYALAANGELDWMRELDGPAAHIVGQSGGRVYVRSGTRLLAVNGTGTVPGWPVELTPLGANPGSTLPSTVVFDEQRRLIYWLVVSFGPPSYQEPGVLAAISFEGRIQWRYDFLNSSDALGPVLDSTSVGLLPSRTGSVGPLVRLQPESGVALCRAPYLPISDFSLVGSTFGIFAAHSTGLVKNNADCTWTPIATSIGHNELGAVFDDLLIATEWTASDNAAQPQFWATVVTASGVRLWRLPATSNDLFLSPGWQLLQFGGDRVASFNQGTRLSAIDIFQARTGVFVSSVAADALCPGNTLHTADAATDDTLFVGCTAGSVVYRITRPRDVPDARPIPGFSMTDGATLALNGGVLNTVIDSTGAAAVSLSDRSTDDDGIEDIVSRRWSIVSTGNPAVNGFFCDGKPTCTLRLDAGIYTIVLEIKDRAGIATVARGTIHVNRLF